MTRRLLLSYLAITIVVLALLEVPLGISYAQRERDRFGADAERDATVVATIYEDDLEQGRTPDPAAAERYRDRTGARVVLVDASGISVLDTDAPTPRDLSTRPEIETALTGTRATGTRRSDTLDTSLLYVAVPVASGGVVHGALRITLDAGRIDTRIHRFWTGLAGVAATVVAVAALVGWGLARSITRPIRRLSDTADRYARGDLTDDDEPLDGPPEIRGLGATMSTMAERLDALLAEQRAFVADASHQLRTPLTALRLRLENLQTRVTDDQATELEAIIDESARLAALVGDLLQLARAEEHATPTDVDLRALILDRTDMWSAVADEHDITVRLTAPGAPVLARAVPGAVEQVLDNLLDNALNASRPGATVRLELSPGDDLHLIVVADEGPGLDDADKERALRRFWRGASATPGTGLGLAIASALATGSGGSIELHDAPGGGLQAEVRLQAAGRGR